MSLWFRSIPPRAALMIKHRKNFTLPDALAAETEQQLLHSRRSGVAKESLHLLAGLRMQLIERARRLSS
ncbi:hypothetical protein [Bradyrhizobium sp. WSM471]|uniref:hypothetical protein n=1 Tax=Bradyrhizobium sp. WSM471 TaxID=319017 RepID=UPI0012FACF86|nr:MULTISPECIES: hypothetical protein [Bradyrhizobium]UFW43176.1 hypothetical protein BcanWSM471_08865 [Bradyrhizobium canariense]